MHVGRRRLEDDLKLHVLEETVGVLAVASVGGATRRLHVADAVWLGPEDPKEGFGRHCSGADFDVVRLLEHAAVASPECLEAKDEFLERKRILGGGNISI